MIPCAHPPKSSYRSIACLLVLFLAGMACQLGGSEPAKTPPEVARPSANPLTQASLATNTRAPVAILPPTETSQADTSPTRTSQPSATGTTAPTPSATTFPDTSTATLPPATPTPSPTLDALRLSLASADAIQLLTSLTNSDFGKTSQVVWSPDGARLAVIGDLGVAMLDAETLTTLWKFDYSSEAPQMLFSLDGSLLVIADGLGYVTFIEPGTGQLLEELEIDGLIAISPDGRTLAYTLDWGVQLLDWKNEQEGLLLESTETVGPIVALDFSADGQKLMAGSWDQSLQVWRVEDGKRTRIFDGPYTPDGQSFCYGGDGSQGNTLVLVCLTPADDYQTTIYDIWLWDVNNDQNQNVVQFVDKSEQGYYSFTASPNRQKLGLFVGEKLEVWNVAKGFALDRKLPATRTNRIAFNPADGGNTLAVWDAGGLGIWDVTTQTLLQARSEWTAAVNAVIFSPGADGRLLAAGNSLGEVELWDARRALKLNTLQTGGQVSSLAFSRDGSLLAADGDQSARVWNLGIGNNPGENAQLLAEFLADHPVEAVAISPDGSLLILGGGKSIEVWEVAAQTREAGFVVSGAVERLAISPDGKTLAVGVKGSSGCKFELRALPAGSNPREYSVEGKHFYGMSFSPDGLSLLLTTDARLQIWDIQKGEIQRSYHLTTDGSYFYASTFSPDQCLVGLSVNYKLELYDVATDSFFVTFRSHAYRTYSVAFSPDGRVVATGGADGAVRLWGAQGAVEQTGDPASLPMCPRVERPPTPTPTTTPTITPIPSPTPFVTATFTPTPPAFTRNLYLADPHLQGEDVLWVQQRLLELGYTEVGTPDGDFGSKTDAVIKHFQELNGLEADGVVGPKTWERLFSLEAQGPAWCGYPLVSIRT